MRSLVPEAVNTVAPIHQPVLFTIDWINERKENSV